MSTQARSISSNARQDDAGALWCTHCQGALEGTADDYLEHLPAYVGAATEGGPRIYADASAWIDSKVVFRQSYCPHCWTAFHSEVVPA
ncbi:hypothetical protein [Nocardioides acrostichi]|uniref:hypothetical protein n=1 Tax=Nocardioides acrostichi TaxID=2784339 RepID=UPI001A9C72E7|nr:hypothetical protein [Nocardioides acrostichi]